MIFFFSLFFLEDRKKPVDSCSNDEVLTWSFTLTASMLITLFWKTKPEGSVVDMSPAPGNFVLLFYKCVFLQLLTQEILVLSILSFSSGIIKDKCILT